MRPGTSSTPSPGTRWAAWWAALCTQVQHGWGGTCYMLWHLLDKLRHAAQLQDQRQQQQSLFLGPAEGALCCCGAARCSFADACTPHLQASSSPPAPSGMFCRSSTSPSTYRRCLLPSRERGWLALSPLQLSSLLPPISSTPPPPPHPLHRSACSPRPCSPPSAPCPPTCS